MKRDSLIIFGLITITLAAFWGVGWCQFVNYDDPEVVGNNPHVTGGLSARNFVWAWTNLDTGLGEKGLYVPLTTLSLMLTASVFGPGPHGFHWVNLAIHVANAVLVYLFFRQATGAVWRSALLAAIFAVHPLRVESVAWVVERKDVLSAFFVFLTMLAYLQYVRGPMWTWYVGTLLLYVATLLAKPAMLTLPFALLLLDYWPLGRLDTGPTAAGPVPPPRRSLTQLVIEKLPLLAVAVAITFVAMSGVASTHDASDTPAIPFAWRLGNVPLSYARYVTKLFAFADLAVFYPRHFWTPSQVAGSSLLLLAITAICWRKLESAPWLAVGWLWFLGILVPMIGLVVVGPHAMADRYTYISTIGLLLMLIWSVPAAVGRQQVFLASTFAGLLVGILAIFTMAQTLSWQNSITLFSRDIKVVGSNSLAELNLGVALYDNAMRLPPGSAADATLHDSIVHLKRAVILTPEKAMAQCALAIALEREHENAEAISHCTLAVNDQPFNPKWHVELAYLLCQNHQYGEASKEAVEAIKLQPEMAEAHGLLGLALCESRNVPKGLEELKRALSIQPKLAQAQRDFKRFGNSSAAIQ